MATRPNRAAEKAAAEEQLTEPTKKSSIPENALRPKDHLPPKADVVAAGTGVTFEYDGETYTTIEDAFEHAQDVDFLEKLQDGNLIGPMRELLDFEEWNRLKENLRPDPEEEGKFRPLTMDVIQPAFESLMKALRAKNS